MTATLAERADLRTLTDAQLADAFAAGEIDLDTLTRESDRRDRAEKARARRRAASRARNAEWEQAAYANYLQADTRCRGFLLSEAGKRTGRDPWPMLWEGSRENANKLASDDLLTFWDYESPRPPSPREYATAKRAAQAEQAVRAMPGQAAAVTPAPPARELAEQAATAPRPAARAPGSIAGMIRALGALTRTANETARAMARVNGGIQR